MNPAQSYHDSLIAQGYTPEQALQYTQQHYPHFSGVTPAPMPEPSPMVSSPMLAPQYNPGSMAPQPFTGGAQQFPVAASGGSNMMLSLIIGGVLLLAGLGVGLYFILDSDDKENPAFVGRWRSNGDMVMIRSDGKICDDDDSDADCEYSWTSSGNEITVTNDSNGDYNIYEWEIVDGNLELTMTKIVVNGDDMTEQYEELFGKNFKIVFEHDDGLAGNATSSGLNWRQFSADDAAGSPGAGTTDDLVYVSLSQADEGIDWAYVKVTISVDEGANKVCANPGTDASYKDCALSGDSDSTWSVGDQVTISESGQNLCEISCRVTITLYDTDSDKEMQTINNVAVS